MSGTTTPGAQSVPWISIEPILPKDHSPATLLASKTALKHLRHSGGFTHLSNDVMFSTIFRFGRIGFELLLSVWPEFNEWETLLADIAHDLEIPLDFFPAVLYAVEQSGQASRLAKTRRFVKLLREANLQENERAQWQFVAFLERNGGEEETIREFGYFKYTQEFEDAQREWEKEYPHTELPTTGVTIDRPPENSSVSSLPTVSSAIDTASSTSSRTPLRPDQMKSIDQTSLRLCCHFLRRIEIIPWARTCHTLYTTLNHPLTWDIAHTRSSTLWHIRYPTLIKSTEQLVASITSQPFLRYLPISREIRAPEVSDDADEPGADGSSDKNSGLTLLDKLHSLQARAHLVGFDVITPVNSVQNETINSMLLPLLNDASISDCIYSIFLLSTTGSGPVDPILPTLLRFPQLRRLHIQLPQLTKKVAIQLSQVKQLEVLELLSRLPTDLSALTILAEAPGLLGLDKLTLSAIDFSTAFVGQTFVPSCFIHFAQLRVFHLRKCSSHIAILSVFGQMPRLRHLYLSHWLPDDDSPDFIPFIEGLDESAPQLDTCTIHIGDRNLVTRVWTPADPKTTPLLLALQELKLERQLLSPPPRLILRLDNHNLLGRL